MATATIYAGAGDGFIRRANSGAESWATLRNATSGSDVGPTSTADFGVAARADSYIYRGFFPFDLSSLPTGVAITSATVYVYVTAKASDGGGTTANNSVCVVESTQASPTTLSTSDYDNIGSTELTASRSSFTGFTTSAYNSFSLNSAGITLAQAAANANTYLKVALISGYDLDNVAPTPDTAISDIEVRYSEHATSGNRPYVVVEYSLPRSTSDSWAWSDAVTSIDTDPASGASAFLRPGQQEAWAWSDAAAPYWRANRTPILVREAGANTTLSGSHTFPQATVTVVDTTGFPSSGTFVVSSAWVQTKITYTGKTGTTFTGCTGGTGTYGTGALVMASDSENHFPQVLTLDNTSTPEILVAYIQKPGHGGSYDGKIVGKKSTNGGLTWGSEFTITNFVNSTGYTGGGFVIQRLLTGRLLILWYEGDIGTGAAGLVKSYIAYSDDNFATLSTPVRLTSPFHANVCAVGFDGYLYTGSGSNGTYGDFYVTCYGNDTSAYDNTNTYNRLMKVTDGGAGGTWTSVSVINTKAQIDNRASEEASLTVLDDGTWVSHLRVEVTGGFPNLDRYQCTSTDLGVTWGGHTRIAQKVSNAAVSHQMPEGHMLTQGTNEDGTRGTTGRQITFISNDRGASWPSTFWRLEETDATYAYGNGSDFFNVTDTSVPLRRVLNAYSQEAFSQAGAQVKFQWYAVENLPLSSDTWTWSDAAPRTASVGKTTSDTWAWAGTAAAPAAAGRATSDTWGWAGAASGSVVPAGASRSTGDTWGWASPAAATRSTAGASGDTWTWSTPDVPASVIEGTSIVIHPQGMVPGTAIGAYLRWEWRGPVAAKLNAGPGAAVQTATVAADLTASFTLPPGEYVAYAPTYPTKRLFFMVTE